MRDEPWLRALVVLAVIIAALYLGGLGWQLLMHFADIVILFLLAWLLAFVLGPLAKLINRWERLPWWAAVGLVYLVLLLAVAGAMVLVVPATVSQLAEMGRRLPQYAAQLPLMLEGIQELLGGIGIEVDLSTAAVTQGTVRWTEGVGTTLVQNAFYYLQGLTTLLFQAVVVLVLSFYIMFDGDRAKKRGLALLTERLRDDASFFLENVDRSFGGYLRGTLIVAIVYALGTAFILALMEVAFVAPLSLFSGVMTFVPFVGPFLAILLPVLIALMAGPLWRPLLTFVLLMILQQIALNVVSPRVMGHSVGMHPLLVFLALLVGMKLAGLWGALFGVPIAAVIVSITLVYVRRVMHVQ